MFTLENTLTLEISHALVTDILNNEATLPSELMHELEVEVMSSMAGVRASATKQVHFHTFPWR